MKGPETFRRLNLDGLDVPILGKACIHDYVLPGIGGLCRNGQVLWHLHDKVRRADAPFVVVVELTRWRHVGRIALRSARIHPMRDRSNLLISERYAVLELADADVRVDVPWRHVAEHDIFLDRLRPRPGFLIR